MSTETSPFFTEQPGREQSRIQPDNWIAPTEDWALCLGSDEKGYKGRFKVGDSFIVAQQGDWEPTTEDLMTFRSRLRGPDQMPNLTLFEEPYALTAGSSLLIQVDNGSPQTVVFNPTDFGTPGVSKSQNAQVFALNDGDQLSVSVDSGPIQTVNFNFSDFVNIGTATALEVATVLTNNLNGASARAVIGGFVQIESDTNGPTSSVQVIGGTANVALSFFTAAFNGAGGISSAMSHEVAASINSQLNGAVASPTGEGQVSILSNTQGRRGNIVVQGGSAAGILAFQQLVWKFVFRVGVTTIAEYLLLPGDTKDVEDVGVNLSTLPTTNLNVEFRLELAVL